MSEHMSPIPSMIYNASVGGHVTNSQQIIDEDYNLEQKDINKETLGVPYNATTPNGMGRVVLKKNDNFKQVVEAQTNGNTIFVIKYDFTLTGNVDIPANCVLEFDGGSISGNGTNKDTITLNGAKINTPNYKIFNNIKITPETRQIIRTSWFGLNKDIDCSTIFQELLYTIKQESTLLIDTDICLDNQVVSPSNISYSKIVGDLNSEITISPRRIYSSMAPSTIEESSLIKITSEGLRIENLSFLWDVDASGVSTTYPVNIVEIVGSGQEGDTYIKNCAFLLTNGGDGSSALKHIGRGLKVQDCLFNTGSDSVTYPYNGIPTSGITCVGKGNADDEYIYQKPANSMRAIWISNNRFHSGSTAIKFIQNPNCEDTCFVNTLISNNFSDAGLTGIWSNSKHRGILIDGNSFRSSGKNAKPIFFFNNSVEGITISNNSIVGWNYPVGQENIQDNGTLFLFRNGDNTKIVKDLRIYNNYIDAYNFDYICGFTYTGSDEKPKMYNIKIYNNSLSSKTSSKFSASSEAKIVSVYRVHLNYISIMNNTWYELGHEGDIDTSVIISASGCTIDKAIILFNNGTYGTEKDGDGTITQLINDSSVIN